MHVDRYFDDHGHVGPEGVLRDNVAGVAADQERGNMDGVSRAVVSHHDTFGKFDLVVKDECGTGPRLLNIAHFLGEGALATLHHYHGHNHIYFVFKECFLTLFCEVLFFERITSKFVKLWKENLRDL